MFSSLLASMQVLADGAAGPAKPVGPVASFFASPLPLMAMMVLLFYFMLWRPQAKKQKETQSMLSSLKEGDEVVTTGGLVGKITGLNDTYVTLQVQEKVRLKVLRLHVTGKAPPTSPAAAAKVAAEAAK